MFIIGVFGTDVALAQGPAALARSASAAPATPPGSSPRVEVDAASDANAVRLLVGRSTLVDIGVPIARVSLTSADIADALVTSPSQLLVHGKQPGSISMFVWDRSGGVRRFEIAVERDLALLSEQVGLLFPGESIQVHGNGKNIVLSGKVSNETLADKAVKVAGGYVESADNVVSLLQIADGPRSNQVLLRVRFAEVSRSAMSEYGMSFFTSPTGINNNVGRVTTQQFSAPNFSDLAWTKVDGSFGGRVASAEGKFEFSDFLNLFLLNERYDLGLLLKALQDRGLFQSLAEPNLVAESGQEASFLAGGEFPIPVAQGSAANMAVSVQFKEFGIRLSFTPTVDGDRVHLKVRPEVSTLDYGNAVVLNGFRIPALSTRRTETALELRNGQTFAIAGLLNNQMQSTMQKIPGIGDIPILGYLFRSKAALKDQTELVVIITPEILPTDSPGVTDGLPRTPDTFLPPLSERQSHAPPAPAFPSRAGSQALAEPTTTGTEVRASEPGVDGSPRLDAPAFEAVPTAAPVGVVDATLVEPPSISPAEQARLDKLAREQAKRDAEAAEKARKEEARRAEAERKEQEKLAREQEKAAERAAKEEAKRAEAERKQQEKLAREQAKAAEKAAKEEARRAEAERKEREKLARENARLAEKAAKALAEAQKKAAEEEERRAAEARRQLERELERQRAIDAAAARLTEGDADQQADVAQDAER
jgi:pilus assembly protein CpaC